MKKKRKRQLDGLVLTASGEINQLDAKDGKASPPTVDILAYTGGEIRPWGWGRVVIDLAGLKADNKPALLLDHDPRQICGQATEVIINKNNVKVTGVLTGDANNPDDPTGKICLHAKNGFVWKNSVGVRVKRVEYAKGEVVVNGQRFADIDIIREGLLAEISFLSIGADKNAYAKVAAAENKNEGFAMDKVFAEWLRGQGFDPDNIAEEVLTALTTVYQNEQAADKPPANPAPNNPNNNNLNANGNPNPVDAALQPIRDRQNRQTARMEFLRAFGEKYPAQIEIIEATGRVAEQQDWTKDTLELTLLRDLNLGTGASARINTGIRDGASNVESAQVYEASLCAAGGMSEQSLRKNFNDRTLETAQRKYRGRFSLGELLICAARANGYTGYNLRDTEEILQLAFKPTNDRTNGLVRAAGNPSTFDISGILSNIANKFIVDYFNSVEQVWQLIAATRPVNDFKQITIYSLTGDFQYEQVPVGGKLAHATAGETSYTNQAKTYGRMFSIDRRDLINDDLGAFTQVSRKLGRGGALSLNKQFWTEFLNNASFFASGNNNFLDGVDTALSLTSLEAAEQLFLVMTDPDGNPLGLTPSILLVPPTLKRLAMKIVGSAEDRNPDSAVPYGTTNTYNGEYRVASSAYMENALLTGNSALKWYLMANPNDMPVIEVCFLNNIQRPTVESAQADFETLGIKLRAFFDFGVAKQEPRGGVAMKGEA